MLTHHTISLMHCPVCGKAPMNSRNSVEKAQMVEEGELYCKGCQSVFPITKGVPDMVPEGMLDGPQWSTWKEHLVGFKNRRDAREDAPERLINRFGKALLTQQAFFAFIEVKEGRILDVGCGPGKFRHVVGNDKLTYYGIDPMPLPGVEDFPFVRGIGEFIPFQDNLFDDVVTLSALDHFKDLDAFYREVIRILKPGGRFHLMQSTHEVKNLSTAVKSMVHRVKDFLEDLNSKPDDTEAPHHMQEFTDKSLREGMLRYFTIEKELAFNVNWYSPGRLFWTMRVKNE